MSRPPLHTDEPVDRFICRPLAWVLVQGLAKTPITPNGVTLLAATAGCAAGAGLFIANGQVAAFWLLLFLILDCADGQLARIRGSGSYLGRAVDGLGDYATGMAVHLGLGWWMYRQGMPLWGALLLMLAAAASMSWCSFLFDRYKRRYRGDTDDLEAMRGEARELGGLRGRLIRGLIPYSKRLNGNIVVPELAAYQERTRAAFRLWRLIGPTMHFTAMVICFALGKPALYAWIAVGPLNLATLAALVLQKHLEMREPVVVVDRG